MRLLRVQDESRGGEEREMGAARARGKNSWGREVGVGTRLRPVAVSCAREKGAVGEGEEDDGWAPLVSRWRERRGKGMAGWADWACRPKVRGGEGFSFFYFFFQLISKAFSI
jgi:hypothetical protein